MDTITLHSNTPVETYIVDGRRVFVKREDLCVDPPGPPFSKCRGVFSALSKLKEQNVHTVAYTETSISMAGWCVSWCCSVLGMRCILFKPEYKTPKETLVFLESQWKKFGAIVESIKPNYVQVNFHVSKKILYEKYGKDCVMLPQGLPFNDTVKATAIEYQQTIKKITPKKIVLCVGSGAMCAGLLSVSSLPIFGILVHKKNCMRKKQQIEQRSGKFFSDLFPISNLTILDQGWEYTQKASVKPPFPCNKYYDAKAWQYLVENIKTLGDDILFWNIGANFDRT